MTTYDLYHLYLAGPFFNDEQKATMADARKMFEDQGLRVCDPQDLSPVIVDLPPEQRSPDLFKDIFRKNIDALNHSLALVACIDGRDVGTAFEIGYFYSSNLDFINDELRPIYTFSAQGFGSNVMISQCSTGHFASLEELRTLAENWDDAQSIRGAQPRSEE